MPENVVAGLDDAARWQVDLEMRRSAGIQRTNLPILDVLDAVLEGRAKSVRPLGEESQRIGGEFLVDVIFIRKQSGCLGEIVEDDIAVGQGIREGCPVIFIDVPVQLDEHLLVLIIVRSVKRARIEAVFVPEDAYCPIDVSLRDTGNIVDGLRI